MSSVGDNEKRNIRDRKRKKRKKREKKWRGKEVQHLLVFGVRTSKRFDGSGSELDCALRGKGSLLLWLVLV